MSSLSWKVFQRTIKWLKNCWQYISTAEHNQSLKGYLTYLIAIKAISLLRTTVTTTFFTVSSYSSYQPSVQWKQSVGKSYKELYNLFFENEKAEFNQIIEDMYLKQKQQFALLQEKLM